MKRISLLLLLFCALASAAEIPSSPAAPKQNATPGQVAPEHVVAESEPQTGDASLRALAQLGQGVLRYLRARGKFPASGELQLVGASPRYQLYPTKDGKLVACGALEDKFWAAFTAAIGLASEFIDDKRDVNATKSAVAKIIASRSADEWRPVFATADCCVMASTPGSVSGSCAIR